MAPLACSMSTAYFGISIFSHLFTPYFSKCTFCSSHIFIPIVNSSQAISSLFSLFHSPFPECKSLSLSFCHLPETSEFFPEIPNCITNKHMIAVLALFSWIHCPSTKPLWPVATPQVHLKVRYLGNIGEHLQGCFKSSVLASYMYQQMVLTSWSTGQRHS